MSDNLTPKQELFAQKYLELGNASEAYRIAYDAEGMKDESIWREAHEVLNNPKVSTRVKELKEKLLKRHNVTIDRVLQEYARIGFLDIRKAFDEDGNLKPIHELDDDTAAAISGMDIVENQGGAEISENGIRHVASFTKKLKFVDKKGALDSMAKHLGMFVEKHEHTGKDGGPIITEDRSPTDAARRIAFLLAQAAQHKPPQAD